MAKWQSRLCTYYVSRCHWTLSTFSSWQQPCCWKSIAAKYRPTAQKKVTAIQRLGCPIYSQSLPGRPPESIKLCTKGC